ncbi:MAG: glutamine--fructose-6-phosphate transaminase (isomerizing) [Dehalococcoidales bacterium]|nr:glutamine--fructose-6-phosphate transaminase (isomerizing) [Dehalococcoidales bacterium]
MCGIIGYIGKDSSVNSLDLGIEALKRLEYRGYDSAGLAFWDNEKKEIVSRKSVGKIANLEKKLDFENTYTANPIILHTRWATHGGVTEENAHPHHDCTRNIWVVHNGIIENYQQLRQDLLLEGHAFSTETDTEMIAHLIEKYFEGNLEEAVKQALLDVEGTYGLAVIARDDPDKIVAARLSSPLLIGIGEDEYLLASDPSAVISRTRKVVYLDDNELAVIGRDRFSMLREKKTVEIDWDAADMEKGEYPHFMLKEIMEQPESLANAIKGRLIPEEGKARLGGLELVQDRLRAVNKAFVVACGTAHHAGIIGEYLLEEYAGLLTKADAASEFRYRNSLMDEKSVAIAISQSGETADTLAAIHEAKSRGVLTLGITNVVGSSQARETDAGVYTRTGPEISVASTKAFTSQLVIMALMTLFIGRMRNLSQTKGRELAEELQKLPELARQTLKSHEQIIELANKYKDFDNFMYLGRKYNYPVAREGALKLKEISYVHAEGGRGGEIKHGPLALMCEDFPTVCLVPNDSVYTKMVSNIQQIKARKSPVIAIATEGNEEIGEMADDVLYVPKISEPLTPILTIIPLQLFAYHIAVLRGCDIDKPRNLAKSVTVE